MKESFIVKEVDKFEKTKADEKHVYYKLILENIETNNKLVLISEEKPDALPQDEFELRKIKAQKKLEE